MHFVIFHIHLERGSIENDANEKIIFGFGVFGIMNCPWNLVEYLVHRIKEIWHRKSINLVEDSKW
jgi:hypothetical protein